MKKFELAKKIANFTWDIDPYGCMDAFVTIGELVRETFNGLNNKNYVSGLIDWLKETIEESEIDEEAEYAKQLLAEVEAYG